MNHSVTINRAQSIAEELRAEGHRITPQRFAVIDKIMNSDTHPSAEEIWSDIKKQFPMTSLATVYNTIRLLIDRTYLKELPGYSGKSSRYDRIHKGPHSHLVCNICNKIIDLPEELAGDIESKVAELSGFSSIERSFTIGGICSECESNRN